MTAQEKFEARLHELGLMDEWTKQGKYGKVAVEREDEIVLLIHEGDDDKFSEEHFPTFNELRKNPKFVEECKGEWYADWDDDKFVRNLACWLDGYSDKCPLFPVDVYFPGNEMMTEWKDFEDDEDDKEVEYAPAGDFETACKYMKGDRDIVCASIYQHLRAAKMPEAEESIFDTNNAEDMKMLCGLYPFREIVKATQESNCRFVLGGLSILEPIGVDPCKLVETYWEEIREEIDKDPDFFSLDIDIDAFLAKKPSVDTYCDELRKSLGGLRGTLNGFIAEECRHGKTLPDNFNPYPTWKSHPYAGVVAELWESDSGDMMINIEEGLVREIVNINTNDCPIEVLVNILEALRQ